MAVTDVHAILDIGVMFTTRKSVSVSICFLFNSYMISNSAWSAIAFFFHNQIYFAFGGAIYAEVRKESPFIPRFQYMEVIYSSFEATEVNAINVLLEFERFFNYRKAFLKKKTHNNHREMFQIGAHVCFLSASLS